MKPVYVITIPHSGTHSLRAGFQNVEHRWTHCEQVYEIAIPRLLDENEVITTFRDPTLVLQSWVNRQPHAPDSPIFERRWRANWKRWGLLLDGGATVIDINDLKHHENADPRKVVRSVLDLRHDLIEFAWGYASALRP